MTKAKAFFDTNIIVYLIEPDGPKRRRALTILEEGLGGVIGVQVLNEFISAARKSRTLSWDDIRDQLDRLKALFEVEPLTLSVHERGFGIAERYGYRIYDSLLLATALEAGCDTFWSEDLQHGQVIEGRLTIRNPFL